MMYPKNTPKKAKELEEAKKLVISQQREQLKAMFTQKLNMKSPSKTSQTLHEKADSYFDVHKSLTTENLQTLGHKHNYSSHVGEDKHDRDDLNSRMSGASESQPDKEKRSETKRATQIIDLGFSPKKEPLKKYKNEEEEWADIYKTNGEVYKAEVQLEKERKVFEKTKFKHELDVQIVDKLERKQREVDQKRVDHNQIMLRGAKEDAKEKKKAEMAKQRIAFEREMREKQIKEIKTHRKQEIKEEKQLDKYMMMKIREEQAEEERAAKKKREEDYVTYRRLLDENEVKRQIMLQEKAEQRKAEMKQIEMHNRLVEEREKARQEEVKARDERVRKTLEIARQYIGKPKNDMEKRQEMKVHRWADKKAQEDLEEELKEKQIALNKKNDTKAYLDQQIHEKKMREKEEKDNRNEQAGIWKESNEKYAEWEKQKAETRTDQMKVYADVLKKQMNEKFEERRITDRLFDLRVTQRENKRVVA